MEVCRKTILSVVGSMLFLSFLMVAVSPVAAAPIWQGQVYSSGDPVVSSVLENGKRYRIMVSEIFWYNKPENFAADAQYYTDDSSNSWNWGNHYPAPDGHSFLQIDGEDKNWGPFSNGNTGHLYSISYVGEGVALTFKIVDWVDLDYDNNDCHFEVRIYSEVTVGGYIADADAPLGALCIVGGVMLAAVLAGPVVRSRRK